MSDLRRVVDGWCRQTGFNLSKDQIACAVRLLQQVDVPYAYEHDLLFAFYTGLKFERERAASNRSTHRLT